MESTCLQTPLIKVADSGESYSTLYRLPTVPTLGNIGVSHRSEKSRLGGRCRERVGTVRPDPRSSDPISSQH